MFFLGVLACGEVRTTSDVESCVIGTGGIFPEGLLCWSAVVSRLDVSIGTVSSAPCCNISEEQTELLCFVMVLERDSLSGTTIFEATCSETL